MNLEGIISVSGKPGLYKVISRKKTGLVVESIPGAKKLNIFGMDKVSALEDISIYTYEGDVPLKEVYATLFKLENGKKSIDHKESPDSLKNKMLEVLENYDQERVYVSDLKKLFQWYNLLIEGGLLKEEKEKENKSSKKKD
jgi:hypothetical protein